MRRSQELMGLVRGPGHSVGRFISVASKPRSHEIQR